jgi:alpha,alpha-trehalose phosphorylase
MAGGWTVAVAGFGGLRDHGGRLQFSPRLPDRISRLRFRLNYQGRCLVVTVTPTEATYRLSEGEPLDVHHHGRRLTVDENEVTAKIPPAPPVEKVRQPDGAAPRRRGRG